MKSVTDLAGELIRSPIGTIILFEEGNNDAPYARIEEAVEGGSMDVVIHRAEDGYGPAISDIELQRVHYDPEDREFLENHFTKIQRLEL